VLRERDFDIIHCHSAKAGFLGRLAARGLRGRVLYTPHCFPFLMRVSAARRQMYRWLERIAGRLTDRLVAVSPSEAAIAARMRLLPEDRIVTIENGIDPQAWEPATDVSHKRAELSLGPGQHVVLSVGALRPQKGHRYSIEAAPQVLKACPDTAFLIAGEGELRPELEALIDRAGVAEHVRLLGARDDVAELLAVADCFVIPSLWEGGPYALLEAMAAGVPVVGVRIPGVVDWVRDGETGYGADPADPASLARAVVAVLGDPAEAGRRAASARDVVTTRNTEGRWLSRMAELYQDAASPPSAKPVPQQ
jgi:glycosyltransferase involved in cell wall biosynthesis